MSRYRTAAGLLLVLAPFGAAAEDAYPFQGRWDCEGATFAFTDTSYNDGTLSRDILAVEAEGSGFILTLPAEQEVVVSEFNEGTMVWLYWSTGERRKCTRLD
jgi:hypothetical protein